MSIKLSSTATKAVKVLSAVDTNPRPVDYDFEMNNAITEMDRRGIDFMAVPEVKRHEAFVLDQKLTQAANEDRREDFNRLLQEWRNCFN